MRRLTVTITVGSIVLLGAIAGAVWGIRAAVDSGLLAFGPASVRVTASPNDATISLGSKTATGTLSAPELEAGSYRLTVRRKGFATKSETLDLRRGEKRDMRVTLAPENQKLAIDLRPKSARYKITCSNGRVLSGTGAITASIPSGATTIRVTAAGCAPIAEKVFVDDALTRTWWLDPSGQLVHRIARFESVPAPKGVAFTPDGRQLWVTALVTQPSIAAYDPATGKTLGSVDLGASGAVEVIFNKEGTRAYASQMQSASVFEIDTKTFEVLRQLKTGSSWTKIVALSPKGTRLYAANWSGDDISEIDLESGTLVRRMPTVDTPRGLWPTADGTRLFVAGFGENSGRGTIAVIDLKTGTSRTLVDKQGSAMRHMVADERQGKLYTSDLGDDRLWVTDMTSLATESFVQTDRKPNTIDISPDGRVLFVSCRGENNPRSYNIPGPEWGTVLLFDARTGKPLDAIVGGNQCTALDLSDDGKFLAFSDFLDGRMRVYAVPPYATLADGKGGRYLAHYDEIVKPDWPEWDGPSPPER